MRRHGFPRYLIVVSTCIVHVAARKVHTHMAKRSLFKNGPSSNGPAISSSWRTVHKGPAIHFAKEHATDGFNQPWCQCLVHLTNNQPHQKVNPKYPLVVRHGHGTSPINGGLIRTNISSKHGIFHCYVWLPEGTVWGFCVGPVLGLKLTNNQRNRKRCRKSGNDHSKWVPSGNPHRYGKNWEHQEVVVMSKLHNEAQHYDCT